MTEIGAASDLPAEEYVLVLLSYPFLQYSPLVMVLIISFQEHLKAMEPNALSVKKSTAVLLNSPLRVMSSLQPPLKASCSIR